MTTLSTLIEKDSEKDIFDQLYNIVDFYVHGDAVYDFFIDENDLKSLEDITHFFRFSLDIYKLLEFLESIKEKIATDYILKYNINDIEDISQFADDIYQFLDDNSILLYALVVTITKNFTDYLRKNAGTNRLKDLLNAEDLSKENDDINDEYFINRIDFDNRKKPFIVIDGKLIPAKNEKTHGLLINNYLNLNKTEDEAWHRPSAKEVDQIAFGHICDGNIYVVDAMRSLTIDDVVKAFKASKYLGKLYYYIPKTSDYGQAIRKANKFNRLLRKAYSNSYSNISILPRK